MKAVLCKAFGPPEILVIEDIESLKPGKGQVVISVKACGVLHSLAWVVLLRRLLLTRLD